MRKLYLGNGDKQFKFADTTTEIHLNAFDDGSAANLTANAKVRIKNDSGYLLGISASITNNHAIITSGQLAQLPIGSYLIELWDTVNGGTAIYPSEGFLALQINENVTGLSGGLVSSITVDDFIQQFSDLSKQLKQEVSVAIANGLKGDTGADGLSAYQIAVINGYKGSQTEWLASLVGATGKTGEKGNPGKDFKIVKTFPSIAEMNGDGFSDGDFTMIASDANDPDDGKLYVWNGTSFTYVADLSGSQGIKGDKGDKGDTGPQGPVGSYIPETFTNLAAIQSKYPTGSNGIMVTADTGHKYIWANSTWTDAGIYQAVGIKDGSVGNKQVSTISASKIVDNQLSPSEAEGQGNINVVGNNDYVMITSNEVQTADKLVGTFIPLTITNKDTLILTANITSSLDAGYTQPLWIADKNKTFLRQLSNVNVPDKSVNSGINAKVPLKITEDPGEYYLLITSKATGTVTYRNLTINVSGSSASTVDKEINDLATKIDKSMATTHAFDTITNSDVQLDKVSATGGIELTRDMNTITATVNKVNAAGDLQAIFFPVHVQNRNAGFAGTVKVAPIKFSGMYTQQIYFADAERNIGKPLGTFPVNSQTSSDFRVNLPASQDFCIALIASVTGTFEFELALNNSTGRSANLEEYATWLDSNTYDHAHMDISRIDYSNMSPKTIDGIEYVAPYHTFGVANGRLNAIYVWTEKAGTYSFCVGKFDQNNLIVDGKYFDLKLDKGFNSIGMNIRTDAASNLFMKIADGVSLYEGNQAIKVQTSGQHIDLGMYSGDSFTDNQAFLPFGYDVTSLSPTDRIKVVEEQQRQNTASISQLQGATVLTTDNGVKYKLIVGNDGTLSTKNMTPKKVRVFGNSLTANPEGFGLAASDPQHDYYYLMSQYILSKNPKADIQRHATGSWEWSTNSSDRQKAFDDSFKPYLDTDTDLVIVQCMENVGSVAAKQTLRLDSLTLLQNIKKASPNAQIIWMYGWWGDSTVFDPAQNACDNIGAKGINLNDIGTQQSMQSYAGQKRTLMDGTVREIKDIEASHPSDAGMQAITDRLITNFDF